MISNIIIAVIAVGSAGVGTIVAHLHHRFEALDARVRQLEQR